MTADHPFKESNVWDDPRITAYVLGELPSEQRDAFEAEMRANAALTQAVQEASDLTGKLETLFTREDSPVLDAKRRTQIVAAATDHNGEGAALPRSILTASGRGQWSRPTLALVALAAGILLLVGVVPRWVTQHSKIAMEETSSQLNEVSELEKSSPENDKDAEIAGIKAVRSTVELAAEKGNEFKADFAEVLEMEPMIPPESRGDVGSRPMPESGLEPLEEEITGMTVQLPDFGFVAPAADHQKSKTLPQKRKKITQETIPARLGSSSSSRMRRENNNQMMMAQNMEMKSGVLSKQTLVPGEQRQAEREMAMMMGGMMMEMERESHRLGGRYEPIIENEFKHVAEEPLSTFSIDVDTASYSKVREYLNNYGQLPPPGAVRVEELINYFPYGDAPPADRSEHPFACQVDLSSCPWNPSHRLARIALNGKTMKPQERPACNLVFLVDTSGSMSSSNKLPLVIEGLKMLTKHLQPTDRVGIVVYASSTGLVLESTPISKRKKIRKALNRLSAGGSTNGGAGISLAYQTAREHLIEDGVNRVILCTDGDFNVGTTSTDQLVAMVEQEAKGNVFLSVLGFGMDNHNDEMLEKISGRGNGNYAFIDNRKEARKVLVEQSAGTLVTIAKDVKVQVEFNPAKVAGYRLIGYENRILAKEDFNDDTKDAGEIGAGHSVTALYEWVPADVHSASLRPKVDELKYQPKTKPDENVTQSATSPSKETMTVKLRYKAPTGRVSTKVDFPVADRVSAFEDASEDHRFTAAVASFAMQLRGSEYAGDWKLADVVATAQSAQGDDEQGLRSEFVELVQKAARLKGN